MHCLQAFKKHKKVYANILPITTAPIDPKAIAKEVSLPSKKSRLLTSVHSSRICEFN